VGEVRRQDARNAARLKVKFVLGDTPSNRAGSAQALAQSTLRTRACWWCSDFHVRRRRGVELDVLPAKIAHISPSATRTSLTQGGTKEATPAFFRVVPATMSRARRTRIHDQDPKVKKGRPPRFQSVFAGLSDAVGVDAERRPASRRPASRREHRRRLLGIRDQGAERADIVFFRRRSRATLRHSLSSWSSRAEARRCSAVDGSNDRPRSRRRARTVELRPDITGIKADAAIHRRRRGQPRQDVGSFGPPSYGAVQVALNAIALACKQGMARG